MMQHRDLPLRMLRWARRRTRRLALAAAAGGASISLLGAGVATVSAHSGDHEVFIKGSDHGSGQRVEVRKGGPAPKLDSHKIQCLRDHGAEVKQSDGRIQVRIKDDKGGRGVAEACGLPLPPLPR